MSIDEITEKIEQLVFDENKVVTYKLLSSELNVHVNKAKKLLNDYVTVHSGNKKDLNVYYAVSGFQKYNGYQVHKLAVIPQHELEKIKKDFSMLSSIHIYSIQKFTVDECALYASDLLLTKTSDDPGTFSAIRHPDLKIRETEIMRTDDKKKSHGFHASGKIEQKSSISTKKTNAFISWQKKDDSKKKEDDKTVNVQNEAAPALSKNDCVSTERAPNGSSQKVCKVADKGKNNIMNLFSKQTAKSVPKVHSEKSAQNSSTSEKRVEEKVKTEVKQVEVSSESKKIVQKKRQKHQRSHDNSENDTDDEWKKPKKKHKRIISAFSDSDSESEEEEKKDRDRRNLNNSTSPAKIQNSPSEDDEEEPIPPTPVVSETSRRRKKLDVASQMFEDDEEEPIPPIPAVSETNQKRKKLKVVSKMFEDEDGFLVTQKVKEYVTDSEGSDNEAATDVKPAPKPVSKPDVKQNFINKKQASLMSFFKQK